MLGSGCAITGRDAGQKRAYAGRQGRLSQAQYFSWWCARLNPAPRVVVTTPVQFKTGLVARCCRHEASKLLGSSHPLRPKSNGSHRRICWNREKDFAGNMALKLLVIDDHPLVLEGVAAALEGFGDGVTIVAARTAEKGLAAAAAN